MIVRYSKVRAYQGQESDLSFTLGKKYLVLGARFQSEGRPAMVVIRRDSDGTPVLAEFHCFSIVDPVIPADWCLVDFGNGSYGLEPKEFAGEFWDHFHDGDPDAEKTFEQVVKKLEAIARTEAAE
ncbi:hypothetical protein [Paraburkholderia kururiensis]|uniref:hypothetical protein n=1 Tax=Paraburkholderia kururiensis TaxID=984307 RepID=UPI0012E08B2F|nr:hypothetical protein [Paraburkholderia kururiensis]